MELHKQKFHYVVVVVEVVVVGVENKVVGVE